jgi:hypothetical protein
MAAGIDRAVETLGTDERKFPRSPLFSSLKAKQNQLQGLSLIAQVTGTVTYQSYVLGCDIAVVSDFGSRRSPSEALQAKSSLSDQPITPISDVITPVRNALEPVHRLLQQPFNHAGIVVTEAHNVIQSGEAVRLARFLHLV